MAWTRVRIDNQRYNFFSFYSVSGGDGSVKETITGGDSGETEHFKFKEIRVHLSSVCLSVEDLIIHLTSGTRSEHNITLLSQAMSGIQDFLWQPDSELCFVSGDTLSVYMSLDSGSNEFGINIQGWAVAS